jgi:hypothetical protein
VGVEDVDAFTRPSWRVSRCVCGMEHEEELLVFPPTKMLMPVLGRLEHEGCKGCIVVPRQSSLPFWSILQGGLVGDVGRGGRVADGDVGRGGRVAGSCSGLC